MDRLRSSDLNNFINAPIITLMRTLEVLVKSVHRIAQKTCLQRVLYIHKLMQPILENHLTYRIPIILNGFRSGILE